MIWILINILIAGFNFYWYHLHEHAINLLGAGFALGVALCMIMDYTR
jgi:hypothetical protein